MDLIGKRVVITGASSGIGYEILKRLLEKNCRVVAAAIDIDTINIQDPNLFTFKCNLSHKEEVDRLFDFSLEKLGDIDLFIANAGFAYYEKIGEADWAHIKNIFDINFISVVYSAEKMKELHGNRPYNFLGTSSAMSYIPIPGYSLYSSTKAALRAFASAYRRELEKGQFFQMVYPIATRTNFFKKAGGGPIPWPTQSSEIVADKIISGILSNKENIHPSKLMRLAIFLNKFFPFVSKIYCNVEDKKFKEWLRRKNIEEE